MAESEDNGHVIRRIGTYSPDGEFDRMSVETMHVPHDNDFTGAHARESLVQLISDVHEVPGSFAWVGLVDPTRPELALVAELFNLEPLEVEDASNTKQRPKFEIRTDGAFALLKTLSYKLDSQEIETGQTSVFIGPWFAITVRYGAPGDLTTVRQRISTSERLRTHGPLAVLYAVMDITVDGYIAVAEEVHDDMREVEQEVFSMEPTAQTTKFIYQLKRENISVRRAVSPLVMAAQRFIGNTDDSIPTDLKPFFEDIGEHILRVHDTVDTIDNSLLTMLMASTALQDLKQNSDMRKISAWVAIAAVPTLAASIFGMNFDNMPELRYEYAYPLALGGMLVVCGILYRAFKKSGWL